MTFLEIMGLFEFIREGDDPGRVVLVFLFAYMFRRRLPIRVRTFLANLVKEEIPTSQKLKLDQDDVHQISESRE